MLTEFRERKGERKRERERKGERDMDVREKHYSAASRTHPD